MSKDASRSPVIVIGGGWAGLSAAVELARAGVPVNLLEAGCRVGGRARSVVHGGVPMDNGQHLMLGAYTQTLAMMRTVGVDPRQAIDRQRLDLLWLDYKGRERRLAAPWLPAPLNLLAGLAISHSFTAAEKRAVMRLWMAMVGCRFHVEPDLPLVDWLAKHRQPEALVSRLWEPLCLAALTTSVAHASTQVFVKVMRDAFGRRRRHSDLLYIKAPLSEVFPEPARRFIEANGGAVQYNTRVTGLVREGVGRWLVKTRSGDVHCAQVIVALPPAAAVQVLGGLIDSDELVNGVQVAGEEAIATVYLQYPGQASLPKPMVGLLGLTGHWVFDHAKSGRVGLISVVTSGAGRHMELARDHLAQRVARELSYCFPMWPEPSNWWVVREKRATFSCRAGVNEHRPPNRTPWSGCWLAGDYTRTGYPSTLEGAVRSGVAAAKGLLAELE